jgi:hypothetical protein
MEFFPLTHEEAIQKGFKRSDYEAPFPKAEKTMQANDLPDITKISDEILTQAIICEKSKKPFRITAQELDFYRRHSIQLPSKHPESRHLQRLKQKP